MKGFAVGLHGHHTVIVHNYHEGLQNSNKLKSQD